jgi:predicted small secreted protein
LWLDLVREGAQPFRLKQLEHFDVRTNTLFRRSTLTILSASLLSLAVAACGTGEDASKDVNALDAKLSGKGSDPAMNAALEDKILVDPALADSSNSNMVKAPDAPLDGSVPPDSGYEGSTASAQELDNAKLMRAPKPTVVKGEGNCRDCSANGPQTLEALAAEQGVKRGKGTCEAKLQYGTVWSARMPTEFPVYPKGRVQEAGGVDGGICDIRVASFTTSASMQSVADYYYTRAKRSGFSADYEIRDGEHVLGGTRDNDGGAYVITLNPLPGGGTSVDIVANNGR